MIVRHAMSLPAFYSLVISLLSLALPSVSLSGELLKQHKFILVGGNGKIGSAVAFHLLRQNPDARITIAGRNHDNGEKTVSTLLKSYPEADVNFQFGDFDQSSPFTGSLENWSKSFENSDCIIHTAGPYSQCQPFVLKAAIEAKVPVYIDISDPLPYIELGVLLTDDAAAAGTTALLAAGAFPGMSNVLGLETATAVMQATGRDRVKDIHFNYFTAGLGGSGTVNLYITNLGFGEAMGIYENGSLRFFSALSGLLLGTVDFFHHQDSAGFGSEAAKQRVGTKNVFAWPFPEAATVATMLKVRGISSAAMGTAPNIWNFMLGILVFVVPRPLWSNSRFSQLLADFSEPLVWLTDKWLKFCDPAGTGETHAMRIDVVGIDGKTTMSTVQAHDSFQQCVGQSCAEFAMDCLNFPKPGVQLPENRYANELDRRRIIQKLTKTPGTFCYTEAFESESSNPQPTNLRNAMYKAAQSDQVKVQQ